MGNKSAACITLPEDLPNPQFGDFYEMGLEIGIGTFASVRQCRRKFDGVLFAVKIIEKKLMSRRDRSYLRQELLILHKVDHPNIINIIDVFDDGVNVRIVLELCQKKDLFDYLVSQPTSQIAECKAAQIIYQISNALQYLHENNVVHRDIKPENILFDQHGNVKLTDFGLAHYKYPSDDETSDDEKSLSDDQSKESPASYDQIKMKTQCGTPFYVAPEIITKCWYSKQCDLWSLGVVLYVILAGYQPFYGKQANEIYALIVAGKYNFNSHRWKSVSDEAKDLITRLLCVNPAKRWNFDQIKKHRWILRYVYSSQSDQ